ncbi:pilus assembly protein TadG-related protein [Streptomyces sp. ME02-8801-2C]|uniref:pilus assembly protein TadG-related protein n=1 Tax=Streptomyces sp. ME02-8801-2C TaxID=3028680 RepID=UPI0029A5F7D1|nr:pilus assembly protein TadG-related protein [Streptomyces sp. ME02-8801-2C]MDX3456948.1 pilus assembly protein TadG-related protein [Streptomyces sp. ME02-8801-2C]
MPIYIWLTGILLFAAVAFFVFAQAASVRNGAQSAADAAALAAAQDARDEMVDGLVAAIEADDDWLDWLDGDEPVGDGAQAAAQALAADNDSSLDGEAVQVVQDGYPGFRVNIQTNYTVGNSIIPGTESMRGKAHATAVVQPRCENVPPVDPLDPFELDCDGETVTIDPGHFNPDDFPDASVLFSVHLVE